MVTDQTNVLQPQVPLRFLDKTGIVMSDSGQFGTFVNLTGSLDSLVDINGRLYITTVDEGGGTYHANIFKRSTRLLGSDIIAHTDGYTTTGTKTIIPDSGSGLTGSISVLATGSQSSAIVGFYKFGVVSSIASNQLIMSGSPLGTSSECLTNVWYGPPSAVVELAFTVPGVYATAAQTMLLASGNYQAFNWQLPPSRLVKLLAWGRTASATTHAIVNFSINGTKVCTSNSSNGLTITSGSTWYTTTTDLATGSTRAMPGDAIELTTTAGDTSGVLDSDLTLISVFIQH
jgi:hypothetical protein